MALLITKDNENYFKKQKDLSMKVLNLRIQEAVEREIRKFFDEGFSDATKEAAIEAADLYCMSETAEDMRSDLAYEVDAQKGGLAA